MLKKTFNAFGKFFDAYTKGICTKQEEWNRFCILCEAIREESRIKDLRNKKTAAYIAEKRKYDKNYARPKNK